LELQIWRDEVGCFSLTVILPFLPKVCAEPPAHAVKGVHFASVNAHTAPLTARTARRFAPPGRAFAFNAPLRVASKAKNQNEREFSYATH